MSNQQADAEGAASLRAEIARLVLRLADALGAVFPPGIAISGVCNAGRYGNCSSVPPCGRCAACAARSLLTELGKEDHA